MRIASIDIGTNSVLLLVADKNGKSLEIVDEKQQVPRLGKGVDKDKNLHLESRDRVLSVLHEYRDYLADHYPETAGNVTVTATSAVRDSSNRNEFLDQILKQTGWKVELLSGDKEAETTFRGALSVLKPIPDRSLILDIGGGSTEIAYGEGLDLKSAVSLDMGSVRFSERFFGSAPPSYEEIQRATESAQEFYQAQFFPDGGFEAVGVAGTVTSVAAIEMGLAEYTAAQLNGYHLKRESIQKYMQRFKDLKPDEIEKKYPVFLKGRGDVILAGLIILDQFLGWCGRDQITVSTGGIRHGILLR